MREEGLRTFNLEMMNVAEKVTVETLERGVEWEVRFEKIGRKDAKKIRAEVKLYLASRFPMFLAGYLPAILVGVFMGPVLYHLMSSVIITAVGNFTTSVGKIFKGDLMSLIGADTDLTAEGAVPSFSLEGLSNSLKSGAQLMIDSLNKISILDVAKSKTGWRAWTAWVISPVTWTAGIFRGGINGFISIITTILTNLIGNLDMLAGFLGFVANRSRYAAVGTVGFMAWVFLTFAPRFVGIKTSAKTTAIMALIPTLIVGLFFKTTDEIFNLISTAGVVWGHALWDVALLLTMLATAGGGISWAITWIWSQTALFIEPGTRWLYLRDLKLTVEETKLINSTIQKRYGADSKAFKDILSVLNKVITILLQILIPFMSDATSDGAIQRKYDIVFTLLFGQAAFKKIGTIFSGFAFSTEGGKSIQNINPNAALVPGDNNSGILKRTLSCVVLGGYGYSRDLLKIIIKSGSFIIPKGIERAKAAPQPTIEELPDEPSRRERRPTAEEVPAKIPIIRRRRRRIRPPPPLLLLPPPPSRERDIIESQSEIVQKRRREGQERRRRIFGLDGRANASETDNDDDNYLLVNRNFCNRTRKLFSRMTLSTILVK